MKKCVRRFNENAVLQSGILKMYYTIICMLWLYVEIPLMVKCLFVQWGFSAQLFKLLKCAMMIWCHLCIRIQSAVTLLHTCLQCWCVGLPKGSVAMQVCTWEIVNVFTSRIVIIVVKCSLSLIMHLLLKLYASQEQPDLTA